MTLSTTEIALRFIQVGILSLPLLVLLIRSAIEIGDDDLLRIHEADRVVEPEQAGSYKQSYVFFVFVLSVIISLIIILSLGYVVINKLNTLTLWATAFVLIFILLFEYLIYAIYIRQRNLDKYENEYEDMIANFLDLPPITDSKQSERGWVRIWRKDREVYNLGKKYTENMGDELLEALEKKTKDMEKTVKDKKTVEDIDYEKDKSLEEIEALKESIEDFRNMAGENWPH